MSSVAWSVSAAGSRFKCARSRLHPTRIPPTSHPRCDAIPTSSTASSTSWSGEIVHPGLAGVVSGVFGDESVRAAFRALPAAGADGHHGYAGGLLEHTVGVATLCRETAQLHPRLRNDLLLAAALLHDLGRTVELGRGPSFRQTEEGRLLGHVHLGVRLIEARSTALAGDVSAELLHAVATHHDRQAARTAEASVLYHANQLDAMAATRPVGDD